MSNRVVWLEGMAVSPHHFQQADIFFEARNNTKWKMLSPFFHGISKINIDTEALEMESFSLRECSGIFPDGTSFSYPSSDSDLPSRSFEGFFPAEKNKIGVYLSLPEFLPNGPNYSESRTDNKPARFLGHTAEIADLNTGENIRPVNFARLNLKIIFEGDALDGNQVIKICELVRDGQGKVIPDSTYIPPLLTISGSDSLSRDLKKFIDLSSAKSRHLMEQRSFKSGSVATFSAESLNNYLLMAAINQFLPVMNHYHQFCHIHPETLFRLLLEMYGSLLNFSGNAGFTDIPRYNHHDLRNTFGIAFEKLMTLIGSTIATNYVIVSLTRTSPVQFAANMKSIDLNKLDQMYLSVSAQVTEMEILNGVQRNMKIGPSSKIETLVGAAIPGLGLVPEINPPSSIPVKAGSKYFRLIQTGELWDEISRSKSMSIHMPVNLKGMKLELSAVMGSNR